MRLQALFFDLDDTLLDTSALLIPAAHREAAEAMVRAGLDASIDDVLIARLQEAARHPREDINRLVAQRFGPDRPEIAEAGRRAFYERDIGPLELDAAVAAMLTRLKQQYRLFLITVGAPTTQRAKVQALGLEAFLEQVVYVDHRGPLSKRDVFASLLEQHGLEATLCVVVGDRPDSEIVAGNSLGMWTVRTIGGEHGSSPAHSDLEMADFTILRVATLEVVLSRIEALGGRKAGGERRPE